MVDTQPTVAVAIRTKRAVQAMLPAATGPTADDCVCPGSRWFPSGKLSARCMWLWECQFTPL